jgi:hypothetical protein
MVISGCFNAGAAPQSSLFVISSEVWEIWTCVVASEVWQSQIFVIASEVWQSHTKKFKLKI